MYVKKLIAITTLCTAMLFSGTFITGVSAAAEDSEGITIPDSFTVDLYDAMGYATDYAVGNGQFAFVDGNDIYIYTVNSAGVSGNNYSDGNVTVYEHTSSILAIEYSNGNLYFSDGSTYLYSNGEITSAEFKFSEYDESVGFMDGTYIYYLNSGRLGIFSYTSGITTWYTPANYSQLKKINGNFYVLKGIELYAISNGETSKVTFTYEDYNDIGDIATNETAQALSKEKDVQIAQISAGTCLLRVDEDYLGDSYFTLLSVTFADSALTAQVLYMPDGGNAALIAVGTKTYLTLKENVNAITYSASLSAKTYYLLDNASVYAIPYENEYTKAHEVSRDTIVTVTGYASGNAFDYDYYKVEYTEGGETISGYVIADLLTTYTFDNDNYEQGTVNGGDQSYDSDIYTIFLVMIIVLLVLIAAGYIGFVATSDRKKRYRRR